MSGGAFGYSQHSITDIADSIQNKLDRQGTEKSKFTNYFDDKDSYYFTYPKEIRDEFRKAIKALRIAHIYAQRIDYYLSGDDGEKSFLERLNEELSVEGSV